MNNKPQYVSRQGLEDLRAELEELVNVRRAEVAARIQEAKEHGDISENAEYEDAKNEQAFIEGRIQGLSALIKNAVIIDEHTSTTHVQIGSTVELQGDAGKETYTIVGSAEAAPASGRISNESPVGRALLGKKKGDKITVSVPAGDQVYKILGINWSASGEESRTMFWADELAATLSGSQVVNDSKTPSGTVHVGSLRGVVLHDAIARALRDHGLVTEFRYGVDDLDAMDSAALLTPDSVDRYMGVPLAHVPAPKGSTAASYARYFVGELFMGTFAGLGIAPTIYWMSELYGNGSMDPYIRTALEHAGQIREIYSRVSHVEKAPDWLPLLVICENCGKIGTTLATDWNGSTVAYSCKPDHVTWATGCGHTGRVLPTSGRVKLPFNVDWAAKWSLFGITVEGCGKDLATAGGSRDRSDAVAREVFQREPPVNVAYEFLNIGGRKMSTSKGTGATAHAIAELLPPELLRFLFLRHKPRKAIDFDPEGDTIPGLFDEFDRICSAIAGKPVRGELPPDPMAILRQSLIDADADVALEAARFRPPFRHLALLVQVPNVDVPARMEAEKGASLDEVERAILQERVRVAVAWLEAFAPDRYKVAVQDALPEGVSGLTEAQRIMLGALADAAGAAGASHPDSGDAWQDLIFGTAAAYGVSSGDAFAALYLAFLGRLNGPRAGWLLASLDRGFVVQRLRDAAGDYPRRTPSELADAGPDQ